jgi:hypothetical protein
LRPPAPVSLLNYGAGNDRLGVYDIMRLMQNSV